MKNIRGAIIFITIMVVASRITININKNNPKSNHNEIENEDNKIRNFSEFTKGRLFSGFLHKNIIRKSLSRYQRKRYENISKGHSISIQNFDSEAYVANIYIGSPPQNFTLLLLEIFCRVVFENVVK